MREAFACAGVSPRSSSNLFNNLLMTPRKRYRLWLNLRAMGAPSDTKIQGRCKNGSRAAFALVYYRRMCSTLSHLQDHDPVGNLSDC